MRDLVEIHLPLEGVEAIRLIDLQGLRQDEAARQMGVSRQTLGRVLALARRTLAEAVVEGLALRIEGGDYALGDDGDDPAADQGPKKEITMTKVAISAEGPTLEDLIDPRFGRAGGFVIVDLETMETEYVDNGSAQVRAQGAGIQAAETVVNSGAGVVLSGFVGPKAYSALEAAGVKIGQGLDGLTVGQAVEKYKAGEVNLSSPPQGGPGRGGR